MNVVVKKIPPLKCPKCGSDRVNTDFRRRVRCHDCKAVDGKVLKK
jgi:transcription initiation factor TFIIIB Brf1 subunit/transcription initiation factor TFIIB